MADTGELNARDILNTLLAGKAVMIQFFDEKDAVKLLNNLNVMKSRDKEIYTSLGLEWNNVVINLHLEKLNLPQRIISATFTAKLPKQKPKYTCFIIDSVIDTTEEKSCPQQEQKQ